MNNVWVLLGSTESGDRIGPYVFSFEPTQQDIDTQVEFDYPDDFAEDCISWTKVFKEPVI